MDEMHRPALSFTAIVLALVSSNWGTTAFAQRYIDDGACRACHDDVYRAWQGSHHAQAMQPANIETVLGDFANASFTRGKFTTTFSRHGERFIIHTDGPDGALHDYEVRYTFGVDPLQQYLIEMPNGRLQAFTIAWNTRTRRWFDLYPGQDIKADDPLHWTQRYQNWNALCGECHTTNYQKNYDAATDGYHTTWSSINVGCQACHGPGDTHVSWATTPLDKRGAAPPNGGFPAAYNVHGSNREQVESCAPCHSRRTILHSPERPPGDFFSNYLPVALQEPYYHADGQVLGEVYEYGSFIQSKMFHAGVRCSDCHDAHGAKLKATGNALCTRCHNDAPPTRFPTLKKKTYDDATHHFHAVQGRGGQCIACHMPSQPFMIVHERHDHSLRVPRPDFSARFGTPNACNSCHRDRTARWASERYAAWYPARASDDARYDALLASTQHDERRDRQTLIALSADPDAPIIARATAASRIRADGDDAERALLTLTRDKEPWLRQAAIESLSALPMQRRIQIVAPLLNDANVVVRNEAARTLAEAPSSALSEPQAAALRAALAAYRATLSTQSDLPSGQLNLAVLADKLGDDNAAEQHYRTALRFDRGFLPARFNLANLYNRRGENDRAARILREGLPFAADNGELHYSLGLLYAEMNELNDALVHLKRAAALLPDRVRVHYNYALALQANRDISRAMTELQRAYRLDKSDPEVVYALIALHAQQGQWSKALPYAHRLIELAPNEPSAKQLLRDIEDRAQRH